ncbi:hypothetical protein CRM22_003557 [Opisthorchis felineus]|uniref:EF-hand domain-containing protein n=1 Tax=Opisthorchis felineus TaxID=147828 RepID=A0A4S2M176_OPIFE|nr:hypothetical protein CRM22_003557 [Opisthorchis felineus]
MNVVAKVDKLTEKRKRRSTSTMVNKPINSKRPGGNREKPLKEKTSKNSINEPEASSQSSESSSTDLKQILEEYASEPEDEDFEERWKASVQDVFKKFDRFEEGSVAFDKLEVMLHHLHLVPTRQQVDSIRNEVWRMHPDLDSDEIRITFDEFLKFAESIYEPAGRSRRRLTEAFTRLPIVSNGMVSRDELTQILTTTGDTLKATDIREVWSDLRKPKRKVVKVKGKL